MTTQYDTETRAALVRIIQRAARRGRAIREQTAVTGDPGREHSDGGGTSAPLGQNAGGVYHDETN